MRRKKKNTILEKILVEDYAAEGKSLARVDGKIIFIEQAVPGDVVDVRLSKSKKDWAEGKAIYIHEFSADRVNPFCSHFLICGGCKWQMLPYKKQLQYKQQQVKDNLQRIGKIPMPEILPVIGSDQSEYYRNKLEFTFSAKGYLSEEEFLKLKASSEIPLSGGGGAALGFHAPGLFDKVVDIDTCYLMAEPNNAIRLAVKKFAVENNFSFYDIRNHTGLLRTMQLRICTTGEVMVNIIFGEDDKDKREMLLRFLVKEFPGITALLYTINTKMNDSLFGLEPIVFSGKDHVVEMLEDFKYIIGPKSFFQTNTRQAEKLYQATREFAELTGKETVYDLYCGTGSIGIFVSKQAKKIIGVELVQEAIDDAKKNAVLNKLTNTSFFAGDVIEICNAEFFAAHGKPDVIITDPPRVGMHDKLVKKILEMEAPVVVYVSCNPATQARDLNLLSEKYQVTKIQPVDMFPHTHHIENVVQLKLK